MQLVTFSFTVTSPDIISAIPVLAADSFTAPVPAGTVLGHIEVTPAGWIGSRLVSGPDAALVAIDDALVVTAAKALTEAREYSVQIALAP